MNRLQTTLIKGDWMTASRIRALTHVSAAFACALFGWDVWIHTRHGVVDAAGEQLGRDFINYWAGARLALQGKAGLAYHIGPFLAFERGLTAANAEFKWYGYPPVAMLLALPVGLLPFIAGFAAWTLAGWALLTRMLAPRFGWVGAAVAWLATPAFFLNAISGQNGAFSAVLLAGGVLLLDRRPLLSGLLFGLLCYKPHLGVLIPVALAAGGRWRTAFAAAATVTAVVAASILGLGWDAWAGFLHNAPFHRQVLERETVNWNRMPTLYAAVRMLGGPNLLAYGIQALSGVLAAACVLLIWRGPAPTLVKGAGLLVAAFLVTPYAWDYDLVALLFAAVWYWDHAAATGWRPGERIAIAVGLIAPAVTPILAARLQLQCGPLVLWALLALLVRRTLGSQREAAPAA
jgi:hypothetical protein